MPDSVICKCVMYADDATLLWTADDSVTLQSELQFNLILLNGLLIIILHLIHHSHNW